MLATDRWSRYTKIECDVIGFDIIHKSMTFFSLYQFQDSAVSGLDWSSFVQFLIILIKDWLVSRVSAGQRLACLVLGSFSSQHSLLTMKDFRASFLILVISIFPCCRLQLFYQEIHCTCNVTLWRVLASTDAVEKQ